VNSVRRTNSRSVFSMGVRRLFFGAALLAVVCMAVVAVPVHTEMGAKAHASSCPDIEVIFARGTSEPPGVGATGQAFVDALRGRLPSNTVEIYPVDYPASLDFSHSAAQGIVDASTKVIDVALRCPTTKIVTGGYSQGAAVAAYLTSDSVPTNFPLPEGVTGPLAPDIARHTAAVILFGKPSADFLNFLVHDAPPITIGQLYQPKTDDLCIPDDPVCSLTGNDHTAHSTYAVNGMANEAANFAAHHIDAQV
jgi:cutinase